MAAIPAASARSNRPGSKPSKSPSPLLAGTIRSHLYVVSPFDPLTLGAVTLLVLLIAGVSTLLPALRTTRLEPTICLRQE